MIKIIFFDCDGVLTFGSIWERLEEFVNLDKNLSLQWAKDYYEGRISSREWEERVEKVYKKAGLTKEQFEKLIELISFNPEAVEFLKVLNKKYPWIKKGIISSSVESYIKKVAERLNLDFWKANSSLVFDETGKFEKIVSEAEDPKAKVLHIKEICNKYKVGVKETIFIGDSYNDIEAFKLVPKSILYKTKDSYLEKFVWRRIESFKEFDFGWLE